MALCASPKSVQVAATKTRAPNGLPQYDLDIPHRTLEIQDAQIAWNFSKRYHFSGYSGKGFEGLPPSIKKLPPSFKVPKQPDTIGHDIDLAARAGFDLLNQKLTEFFVGDLETLYDYVKALGFQGLITTPLIVKNNTGNGKELKDWLNDEEFGRQRLQGLNPEKIVRVDQAVWTNLKVKLPIDQEPYRAEVERIGTSLETAIQSGVLYVLDYSVLDSTPTFSTIANSYNRYVCAPIALFFNDRNHSKKFLPVAIELFPQGSKSEYAQKSNEILFSDNSPDWTLAKIWVNSVDGGYMEVMFHLFECHMLGETFLISTRRQFSKRHPIRKLLDPHFLFTVEINEVARDQLLSLDGAVNRAISAGSAGAVTLIQDVFPTWNFLEHNFVTFLKARGFSTDNAEGVDGYFYRDDGLKLWNIIETYIAAEVNTIYLTDDEVVKDFELQGWATELQDKNGGNIKGVTKNGKNFTNKAEVIETLATLVWTLTAKHSLGNSGQYEYYGFIPNVPGAMYSPPTIHKGATTWKHILEALPPKEPTLSQISTVWLLADIHASLPMIGQGNHPQDAHFKQFQTSLKKLSDDIKLRNNDLLYPYTLLDPANIGNSIYI